MNNMSEEEIYEQAKKRVQAKRGFYRHLFTYILVNIILVLVWAFPAGGGYPWFLWVIGGWGIAIIINFVEVFLWPKGSDQTAIEKEADKIRGDKK
ncbi:MAG: 2TM domain-containing protein [Dehalococcoidales bacterium]|nr:MAG: 2TM domain-containing protein [Dehalococcoidales bacterium]